MRAGLEAGIHQFNVESEPELMALDAVARGLGTTAPVALRINPDIDAGTHAKITTGTAETKFGIPWTRARAVYGLARDLAGIRIVGVDLHIGSQITALAPFEAAFARAVDLIHTLRADGHDISRLDFGGGLGAPYRHDAAPPPDPAAYGAVVSRLVRGLDVQAIFEPGRLIAANAGILLTRVVYVKHGENRTFLIIDAGMNDLMRPALYDAHHDILPIVEAGPDTPHMAYDVVGPVCESTDIFARDRELPVLAAGDLVAIMTAGAYGAVMASAYNARPPAPEVMVRAAQWSIVRPRMSEDALVELDRLPPWL
jgi:diaminopimelate decarboxylase